MTVDELKDPNGIVLEVATKGYPGDTSKTLTGVVAGSDFLLLKADGVTGEKLPVNCVTIGTATVNRKWGSLREFFEAV